jgi:hypothetical protein
MQLHSKLVGVCVSAAAAAALLAPQGALAQGAARAAIQEQTKIEAAAEASQKRINQLDDDTQKMLQEFRLVSSEAASLKRYNQQLLAQISSQEEELTSIQNQIVEIERTNREIYPLMERMVSTLDQFVQLDIPFLIEERTKRVTGLKELMARADVSTSEKFRRILEAYQIEMEYGRTLSTYEGKLGEGADAKTVQFLQLGRIALLYQTLDSDTTGYWDATGKKFVEDNDYASSIKRGLKVAKKQTAPDLIIAPVQAPTAAAAAAGETK